MGEGWLARICLPRLQPAIRAGFELFIGALWSLWHIPLYFIKGTTQYTGKWRAVDPDLPGYSAFVIAWSIQYTGLQQHEGSVLLAAVVHGAGKHG